MYSDDEKKIFEYHDGKRVVRADPVTLQRRLTQLLGGDPNGVIARSNAGGPEAVAPTDQLLEAVRIAFGMPWDEGAGPDEAHCFAVLDAFNEFLEKKNRSGGSTPTRPRHSVVADSAEG